MKTARAHNPPEPAPRGRPRAFDPDRALDEALEVFWRKGYEGASIEDLAGAMGINRPSLYAAFGNKEALFRKALDRYGERSSYIRDALSEPTARRVAERLLRGVADALTEPNCPRGCLMVQGALSCGDEAGSIREELCSRRAAGETELRRRLERARTEGDLPRTADAAGLARFIVTVIQGMSVQASGGASRRALRKVAQTALEGWPA